MIKRLLLAASVMALTAGGAYAQGSYSSSPAQAPAAPPPAAAPAPAATGAGATGHAPKAATTTHAAMHATSAAKVKEAQQALQEAGLYKGKVDGKFGPQTKAAVKEFQKENGLKQTAHLDSATMKKLTQAGAAGGGAMPSGGTTSH
ncbi:MAG: peptidoglycan-binding protein [Alphaproteobacteria bacterium]|nr:peptidoglycan-binding protein [Alphaproteobacteria bacterium]